MNPNMEDLSPQLKEIIADMVFQIAILKQQVDLKEKEINKLRNLPENGQT